MNEIYPLTLFYSVGHRVLSDKSKIRDRRCRFGTSKIVTDNLHVSLFRST